MYPTVDKLKLDVRNNVEYWIIPVKESTYQTLCKVAANRGYVKAFVAKNPHLADKINDEGILIQDTFIKWDDMLEVEQVSRHSYPHDIASYCKKPRVKYDKSIPNFYDYHAQHYEYCSIGYTTISGMWNGIWEALRKPDYILIYGYRSNP